MKVIKKITAMMLSIMMVLGMCSVVGAADAGTGETGSITIKNAIVGQDYKIYKILTLESYEPNEKLYSYKPAQGWEAFFGESGKGSEYVNINENGYVTWKTEVNEAKAAELAQAALEYATANVGKRVFDETNDIHEAHATSTGTEKTMSLTVDKLPFGYYLVDSSAGALCSLNTTNPEAEIQEKNGVPSVDKKVSSTDGSGYNTSNEVNIGDPVYFQTIIKAQSGAQNYVLHDTMCEGLSLQNDIQVKLNNVPESMSAPEDYSIYLKKTDTENKITDQCTFEIKFTESFCNKLKANDEIYVTYSAILNGKAFIGVKNEDGSGNTNTTKLTYGDNKESTSVKTETYTYKISVFKYYQTETEKTALAGAKFALYTTETGGTPINLVKKEGSQNYRKALTSETETITKITTDSTGEFNIQGLKPGQYWLEETAAPKGYNKLAKRIKIAIGENGLVNVGGNYGNDGKVTGGELKATVEVENKSGSLLPSTGGMGTTIFYIAGALLVLISGVVLIAKKRTDSK